MARTRLRQLEQIRNSLSYNDNLNMSSAENQPGNSIGSTSGTLVSFTTSTIVVPGNYVTANGANSSDRIAVSGSTSNDGTYDITNISYDGGLNQTTVTVSATLVSEVGAGTASFTTDPNKNLRRDLDHIRTQLRLLNRTANWYDPPTEHDAAHYELKTGTAYSAGTDIVLASQFDAGQPYTLKVFVNGLLMLASTVVANAVTVSYDYVERNATQPVGMTELGDRIRLNFDIVASDLLQFKWTKKP